MEAPGSDAWAVRSEGCVKSGDRQDERARGEARWRGGTLAVLGLGLTLGALGVVSAGTGSRSQAPRGGEPASVSYDARGRILHRFLPPPAGEGAPASTATPGATPTAAAEPRKTPTFVYDPRRGTGDAAPPAGPAREAPPVEPVAPPLSADRPVPRRERGGTDVAPAPADPDPGPMSEGDGAPPDAAEPANPLPPTAPDADPPTGPPAPGPAPEAPDGADAPAEAGSPGGESDTPPPGATSAPDAAPPDGPDSAAPQPAGAPEETTLPQPDRIRPDRATEQETNLEYFETFNPSIVPYKRGRALDAVDATLELHLAAAPLVPVAAGEIVAVAAGRREVFSAEAVVEARGDEAIPLPSVSAADAILSWEVDPPQQVVFLKDGASNLYVRLPRAGRARLRWRVAAPLTWFSRGSDAARRLSLAAIPEAVRPKPPPVVRQQALEVARAIGVPRGATLGRTLDALVLYFRGFSPGEPPPERAGVYRDLALGKVGVCRHRAYAFVATALGLGVPARYVYNEAHVFVEVWLPADAAGPAGWTRIDLGGGADTLDVHGARDKTLHQPPPDAFPVPDGFDPEAMAGATEVRGLPPTRTEPRTAEGDAPAEVPRPRAASTDAAAGGTPAAGAWETGAGADGREAPSPDPATGDGGEATGDGGAVRDALVESWRWPASAVAAETKGEATTTPRPREDRRAPTSVRLDEIGRRGVVTRGTPFDVRGQVTSEGGDAAPFGFVQVLLVPGGGATTPWALGGAHLDADGRFTARVAIPVEMPPGSYELVVEYPGSTSHRASMGR